MGISVLVTLKKTIFWVATPCGLTSGYQRFESHPVSIFRAKDGPKSPHGFTVHISNIDKNCVSLSTSCGTETRLKYATQTYRYGLHLFCHKSESLHTAMMYTRYETPALLSSWTPFRYYATSIKLCAPKWHGDRVWCTYVHLDDTSVGAAPS
jgi:hypothetical protein